MCKYGSEEASDATNPCCNNAKKFNWIYPYVEWLKKMNANLRLKNMTLVQSLETYIVNKYFKLFNIFGIQWRSKNLLPLNNFCNAFTVALNSEILYG